MIPLNLLLPLKTAEGSRTGCMQILLPGDQTVTLCSADLHASYMHTISVYGQVCHEAPAVDCRYVIQTFQLVSMLRSICTHSAAHGADVGSTFGH